MGNLVFPNKAIRKLKGEGGYRIKSPIGECGEKDIAIETHCDAGGGTDQIGQSGPNLYLWFLLRENRRSHQKCRVSTVYCGILG